MIWAPDPNKKRILRADGSGNMGTLLDRNDTTARFRFDAPPDPAEAGPAERPFVLTQVQVKFTGTGDQGVATLQMMLDSDDRLDSIASPYDFVIDEWAKMGFDSSAADHRTRLNWYPSPGEHVIYTFQPRAEVVFLWTDPGTTDWGIEVSYELL